ncbi:hypothetical protein [Falsihalocynthiibacter arcticus]|uniref:Transcription elongation factor GreA/GreB C-terminal domain-containing protein n=1 Tax=Falsihalocynthiibacter arcticus TaxID=1579316 RepID=A0A126V290_9RHOB|nr:hypothetical protein [Falsihalocynthiibacter arcticus]AML52006.1 hypothetical protein RC74_12650 [Falsihalocynthiibacter arcticus]
MKSLVQAEQSTNQSHSILRALRNFPSTLPKADHQKLQEHLDDCARAMRPSSQLLAYVLANKLMNTRPVTDVYCSDLVIGGCHVTYAIDGETPQTGLLVHRARAGSLTGVIPVASLLGATLIGMRVGQRAPLLYEDRTIGKLLVIDVTHSAQAIT